MEKSNEQLVAALSTHWVKYVFPSFVFCMLLAANMAIVYASRVVAQAYPEVSMAFIFLNTITLFFLHHWLFHKLLSEAMEDIIITNKRVIWIEESLYCCDNMRQIPLDKIQGVEAEEHGILQTVLGYGTLWFDTGGTITKDSNATMKLVPHPHRLARDINQLLNLK